MPILDDLGRMVTHDLEVVYVAGAYTASKVTGRSEEDHVRRAHVVGCDLVNMGFVPVIPHNAHYLEQIEQRPYEEWMRQDQLLIPRCDAIYRMPDDSKGADEEVEVAASGYSKRLHRWFPRPVYVFFQYETLRAARDAFRAQAKE